jgi:hypothetical protein
MPLSFVNILGWRYQPELALKLLNDFEKSTFFFYFLQFALVTSLMKYSSQAKIAVR